MPSPATSTPQPVRIAAADAVHDATLYRATTKKHKVEPPALVLHLHAGAFVSAPTMGTPCIVRLLLEAGATVLSLRYPLAPEHPFPQAPEAAFAALTHLYKHRRSYAGSPARVFLAGEEAGGNLAAAAALMARDRGGPEIAGQLLFSPMLDVCVATASMRGVHAGPVGCRFADGWRSYLPRASDALHPYATPGSAVRLASLPPTLLVTSKDDPMRDEAEAYAQRLRHEGIAVEELVLTPHTGFPGPYMETSACDAEWMRAVHAPIRRFLQSPGTPPDFEDPTTMTDMTRGVIDEARKPRDDANREPANPNRRTTP